MLSKQLGGSEMLHSSLLPDHLPFFMQDVGFKSLQQIFQAEL